MLRYAMVLVALSACTTAERVEVDEGAGSPPGLSATLDVRVVGDSVRFVLHVTNETNAPLTLEFATSQRHDFEVARPGGEAVWRWSADRAFAQMLGTDVLQPGESRRYEGMWVAGDADGEYVATGRLTSHNYPVELRTVFRVPDG